MTAGAAPAASPLKVVLTRCRRVAIRPIVMPMLNQVMVWPSRSRPVRLARPALCIRTRPAAHTANPAMLRRA